MAKFNLVKENQVVNSFEGGEVYVKSPIEEWINFLFSSYVEDRFYEDANEQLHRFLSLTEAIADKYGYEFVARCAFFARNELGMRSISQLVAAWLNDKKFDRKRKFFAAFPHRPDDVAEVFAALDIVGQKYSHALNRGFADYLSCLSEYSLGKYQMKNHTWNMHDIINRTHAYSSAIDAFQKGDISIPDTWETSISAATTLDQKKAEWRRLVEEKKLGYLALIRNLRNIYEYGVIDEAWIEAHLVPQLTNEASIRASLVFPYQIYSAAKNSGITNLTIRKALSNAFKVSVSNMPMLPGLSAILLDVSGSMECPISRNSSISIKEAGAVYAAALMLANPDTAFIKFGNDAERFTYNLMDDIFSVIEDIQANSNCGYGTDIVPAFQLLDRHYDRIFLISDMQVMAHDWYYDWYERDTSAQTYNQYCATYGTSQLYSFDLGNYHTQYANSNNPNVHLLTSLSDKTFKIINLLSQGENIVDYINNVYDY